MRFSGEVSIDEVVAGIERLWADPEYDPHFCGIVDLQRISLRAQVGDVAALLQFLRRPETSIGSWAAIFSDPVGTALGMLFLRTNRILPRFDVFSSWEGACAFLGLELSPSVL